MCGIIGYTGGRAAAGILYEGLKRLEYRGYDSAGMAVLDGGEINCVKKHGRVSALSGCLKHMHGCTGIGHTRWATHGEPSERNAHPHASGRFALVHNGIIENYALLKTTELAGVDFSSDTDSEVIVKLIEKYYNGDILLTVSRVASLLKGSYAFALICADLEGLVVAKRNNPAVIGCGDGENFVASDLPALAGLCKQIIILKDGDIALVTKNGVNVFDENLQGVIRETKPNPAVPASLSLDGCPHYMLKEIREVPQTVAKTVASYPYAEDAVKKLSAGMRRVIITGCGTAYNSGIAAKRFTELLARIPAEAETAGEFRYKKPVIDENTVVVAISQSGETADTVGAAKLAKSLGAKVIAVTNSPYSALTLIADAVVPVEAGPEICVAATKSYSGQLAALYMLANTFAGVNCGDCAGRLSSLPELCEQVVEKVDVSTLADMCARSSGTYFMGRALDYAVALEGSLKLKEISYVPSEAYPAGELKHGTLALIDIKTFSVFIITDEELAEKSCNAVEQVLARRGKAAVISNIASVLEKFAGRAETIIIPPCDKLLSPLVSSIVLQKLAYETALLLSRDPDKPRNLAKSVTVE